MLYITDGMKCSFELLHSGIRKDKKAEKAKCSGRENGAWQRGDKRKKRKAETSAGEWKEKTMATDDEV